MILFTGASGFLGRNIYPILSQEFRIDTIGLSTQDTFNIDLSTKIPELNQSYNIVLHAAGKAHTIPHSKEEENQFFQINLKGTQNLCTALEVNKLPRSIIFISTVAVYGLEKGSDINEKQALMGNSPYAISKILAEEYLKSWCANNKVILGILRPSLIAGKDPPGNLGAMIHGIQSGKYFRIGDGTARKSILMAEDIAKIIPKLAEIGGVYNVCDSHHPSFAELDELISNQLNKKIPKSIPYWTAKCLAYFGDHIGNKFPFDSVRLEKVTQSLTFSNEKAKRELEWEPLEVLQNFKIR